METGVLDEYFAVRPYHISPFKQDTRYEAESFRKCFLYVVSPLAFERDYSNDLLSNLAKQVNLSQSTGMLAVTKHSSLNESRTLQLTFNAVRMMFSLNDLELKVLMMKINAGNTNKMLQKIDNLNKMLGEDDLAVILEFGREMISSLELPNEWSADDGSTLLFIVALLIVHDEIFRKAALKDVTSTETLKAGEVDSMFTLGSSAHLHGEYDKALKLALSGLQLNPFSPALYNNLWCAYFALGQYEYAQSAAIRQVLLSPDEGLGYLQWILSVEAMGNIKVAKDVREALTLTKVVDALHFSDECYDDFSALKSRLATKDSLLSSNSQVSVSAPAIDWNKYFKDNDTIRKKRRSNKLGAKVFNFNGIARDYSETGVFCWLPSCKHIQHANFRPRKRKFNIKKSTDLFVCSLTNWNAHYVAFKENYGFVPFQWIPCFPHDSSVDYEGMEPILLDAWFVSVISPMAFGFNYTCPLLVSCAEKLDFVSNIPSHSDEISPDAECRLLKLIFQVFNFVTSERSRMMVVQCEVKKLSEVSDPMAYGKSMFVLTFDDIQYISSNDDKLVLAFMALLFIGTTERWSELAYKNVFNYQLGNQPKLAKLLNRATKAIRKRKYVEGLQLYRQILDESPLDAVIFHTISQVYIVMGEYELARWFALRAIWLNPSDPTSHFSWFRATISSGRTKEALAVAGAIFSCLSKTEPSIDLPNSIWKEYDRERRFLLSNLKDAYSVDKEMPPNKSKRRSYPDKESRRKNSADGKWLETSSINRDFGHDVGEASLLSATSLEQISVSTDSKVDKPELSAFSNYLHKGSKQLLGNLYKSAAENYALALELLHNTSRTEQCLTEMDEAIIKYCYAKACVGRHTYEDIFKGIEMFHEILQENIIPPLMTYYGKGLAYVSLNRFADAIEPLQKALSLLENSKVPLEIRVYPGLPDQVIDESSQHHLRETVVDLLAVCHSPQSPDAICHAKISAFGDDFNHSDKIYCSDPDFQGYVRASCRERCRIEFHPRCFKKMVDELNIHGDKGMIGYLCLTPDCNAVFVKFEIFGANGLVRKTFQEQVERNVNVSKTRSKKKNKVRNEPTKKDFNVKKQLSAPANVSNAHRENEAALVQQEKETSRSKDPKIEIAMPTIPDLRSAEDALFILKKLNLDSNQQTPKKLPSRKRQTKSSRLLIRDELDSADLQMQTFSRGARPNSAVSFDSEIQFPSLAAHVRQSNQNDNSTFPENAELKTTLIDFVKEFIAANGPISLSSPQFLDFINCTPIGFQELISHQENGILSLFEGSTILFIGDVAFSKEKLVTALRAGSTSITSCLDLAIPAFRRPESDSTSNSAYMEGNLRRWKSGPGVMVIPPTHHDEAISHASEPYNANSTEEIERQQQASGTRNGVSIDAESETYTSYLEETNRFLMDELQSYKDKLIAADKQTNLERKGKLQAMEKSSALEKNLKEEKLKSSRANNVLEQELSRKCCDLQSQVALLQANLAAMELNHGSLVFENRQYMDRLLFLEKKLAEKVIETEQ